ncbi:putative defense protein 3 isoform X2 [Mytilus californianus]|nr:putative defense protein 3 isoform X2 [Mytilus californianus]XP_052081485.1 putative defense protein 3 isoform X2 [Mytilus californianus]
MGMICLQCFVLLLHCSFVHGTSKGALPQSCNTMTPGHTSTAAQTSPAPYSVTVSKTKYTGGDTISVTLSKTAAKQFKGYLIQARNQDGTKIPGFNLIANSKYLKCDSPNDAVTHTEATEKDSVTFQFTAPTTSKGNITIFTTAVENYSTYWVMMQSDTIIDAVVTGASSRFLPDCVLVAISLFCFHLYRH